MAEDTLSKILKRKMLPDRKCVTENFQIHGYAAANLSDSLSFYGEDAHKIKGLISAHPSWGEPLSTMAAINTAQIVWAVRNEMARTVEDVLARRTRILFIDAQVAYNLAPKVAEIMMEEMGLDESWKEKQIESFS
jgi:glycerol-3-phosphate dehydrogenase